MSALLDDAELADAAALACRSVPPAARVGPAVRAHLIRWAAHIFQQAAPPTAPPTPDVRPTGAAGTSPAPPLSASDTYPGPARLLASARPVSALRHSPEAVSGRKENVRGQDVVRLALYCPG